MKSADPMLIAVEWDVLHVGCRLLVVWLLDVHAARKAASAVETAASIREFCICAADTTGELAAGEQSPSRKRQPDSRRVVAAFATFRSMHPS